MDARRAQSVAALLGVALIPAMLGSASTIFNDGDVSWHIATGQWILDNRAIPHADPFSFTWAGKPWVPIDWLAEVIMATVHGAGGYPGLAALVSAALMALCALVFFNARRFVGPWIALGTVVAMVVALIPMMLARPHLLAWPMVAGWLWLMLRARRHDRAPPLLAALLIALWVNFHGSFAIALVIAAAFGLEALVATKDRMRALRQWAVFGLACALAALANANGIAGIVHPLKIANLAMLPLISEWKRSSPSVTPFFFALLALLVGLALWRRPSLHPVRWLLLAFLLVMAMLQVRHQAVFAIAAAMVLPEGFARAKRDALPFPRATAMVVLAVCAVLVAIRAAMPIELPENERNPWRLIAAVPADLRGQPMLNGYSMGGPLILSGIRPYIDGRADMYGDDLVIDYKAITEGDAAALQRAVNRWDIGWAIIPTRYDKLVALLDRMSGWRMVKDDAAGRIYVRDRANAS
jgi:hypothetical protein